jgi:hypothetical protein
MTATVKKFLSTLKVEDLEAFNTIDLDLSERYLRQDQQGFDYFGHVKPSNRERLMLTVAGDIFSLINSFQSYPTVTGLAEYGLLNRVFMEQCQVRDEEKIQAGSEIALKSNDEAESSVKVVIPLAMTTRPRSLSSS